MSENKTVSFTLNGEKRTFQCSPGEKLLDLLRRHGYKGVKFGCGEGSCGVCTIIMDGRSVLSCLLHAFQAEGRDVQTIEGVGDFDKPHPFQKALVAEGAVQCGYCTPAMVLSAKALLDKEPQPDAAKAKEYMDGVLCRCTGYEKIWGALKKVGVKEEEGQDDR